MRDENFLTFQSFGSYSRIQYLDLQNHLETLENLKLLSYITSTDKQTIQLLINKVPDSDASPSQNDMNEWIEECNNLYFNILRVYFGLTIPEC